jgi:hypothetical protein
MIVQTYLGTYAGADYAYKSGSTWNDCLGNYGVLTGVTDASDTSYLYVGKRYWTTSGPAQHYAMWKTLLRFVLPTFRATDILIGAKLVFFVETNGAATGFTVQAYKLSSDPTFPIIGDQWWSPTGTLAAQGVTGLITSNVASQLLCSLDFTAGGLATLTSGSVQSYRVHGSDVTTAPTGDQYLRLYSGGTNAALRPYLVLKFAGRREQIVRALVTYLGGITEIAGFNTTPQVSRIPLAVATADSPNQYPSVSIIGHADTRELAATQTEDADWRILLVAAVYNPNRADLDTDLNALIEDIETRLDANERIGLTTAASAWLDWVVVESVETEASCIVGNNRAYAFITLAVKYARIMGT